MSITEAREYSVKVFLGNYDKSVQQVKEGMVVGVGRTVEGLIAIEFRSATSSINGVMTIDTKNQRIHHFCHAVKTKRPCWHLAFAVGFLGVRKKESFPYIANIVLEEPKMVQIIEDLSSSVLGKPGNFERVQLKKTGAPAASSPAKSGGIPRKEEESVSAAYSPSSDLEKVADYLAENKVPMSLINRVLEFRSKYSFDPQIATRIKREAKFIGAELKLAIGSMLLGKNVLLTGPKGTGKNVLVESLSWVFGLPLYEVNGNSQTDIAALAGDKTLVRDEHSRVQVGFEFGTLAQAMQAGGLILVDEFNTLRPDVAVLFHGLDHRKRIEIPSAGIVEAQPSFRFIGAMNVGYAGTLDPNEATVDRTVVIDLGYTSKIADIIMQQSLCTDRKIAERLERLFKDISAKVENGEVSEKAVTLRGLLDAADLMTCEISAREAIKATVANKVFDTFEKKVLNDVIESIFVA